VVELKTLFPNVLIIRAWIKKIKKNLTLMKEGSITVKGTNTSIKKRRTFILKRITTHLLKVMKKLKIMFSSWSKK